MTLTPFSSLVPEVAISAAGCPDFVIEGYLRKAAIRTCERTHYWRTVLPGIPLTPGVWSYQFTGMPDQSEVFTLMGATMNGQRLPVVPPDVFTCYFTGWTGSDTGEDSVTVSFTDAIYNMPEYDDGTLYNSVLGAVTRIIDIDSGSQPKAISRMSPCEFIVLPKPGIEDNYAVRPYVVLRPTRTATGIDDCILGDLGEAIVHGALQELLLVPGAHWTDRDLASYHAKQYSFKVTERRARANLGFSRGALYAHPQFFGV